jgi:predicted TIM-barrel enzyme
MTSLLRDLFGVAKPVIAMVHLPALPGRPRHGRRAGLRPVIDAAARNLAALLANTGVTADSVRDVLAVADGAIVGTALKAGGVTWNPVDLARAARFMTAARRAREGAVSA